MIRRADVLKVLSGVLFIYLQLKGLMLALRGMIIDPCVASMDTQNTTIVVFMAGLLHLFSLSIQYDLTHT